jgi:hypothetical protein
MPFMFVNLVGNKSSYSCNSSVIFLIVASSQYSPTFSNLGVFSVPILTLLILMGFPTKGNSIPGPSMSLWPSVSKMFTSLGSSSSSALIL